MICTPHQILFGDQIKRNEMGRACGMYGRHERLIQVLVGKPDGKRPQGRPRCRWEANIKMDLQEMGRGVMDRIDLAQDRVRWWALVNMVINLCVPYNAGNFVTDWGPVSFSGRSLLHGVDWFVGWLDKIKEDDNWACGMHEEERNMYRFLVGKTEGKKDHLEDLGVDGRILNWIFQK